MLATLVAYSNTFHVPFVYDDLGSIPDNPTLRHVSSAFIPPPLHLTVSGRPVLNASFALNYALSGTSPWSYHALNLLIHALAGLALFGVVRRTLQSPWLSPRFGRDAFSLSLAVALLWTLHPLQTEAVTYTVQRAESLCGLFYLVTLYCFARGAEPRASPRWLGAAIAACGLGMATKEVMATAPLVLLLYDRAFLAGDFRSAFRARGHWYAAFAATWLVTALCLLTTGGNRGGAVGFGTGVSWWSYGLTQFEAIVRYLALSFWPHPLVFDYGTFWVGHPADIIVPALLVVLLLSATAMALRRNLAAGFAGAVFFLILSPTSLVPGTTQMIVEHRMYLSLAAVLAVAVLGAYHWLGRRTVAGCLALALLCGVLTYRRNLVYGTEISLWADTVATRPANAIAHGNLGLALMNAGALPDAALHLAQAVELNPDYLDARQNLGTTLFMLGRTDEAIAAFTALLQRNPSQADAHSNLSLALLKTGRIDDAISHGREAIHLQPASPDTHFNLANVLASASRPAEARVEFEATLRLNPAHGLAHLSLGHILLELGQPAEAVTQFEAAVRLLPNFAPAQSALAQARATTIPR